MEGQRSKTPITKPLWRRIGMSVLERGSTSADDIVRVQLIPFKGKPQEAVLLWREAEPLLFEAHHNRKVKLPRGLAIKRAAR